MNPWIIAVRPKTLTAAFVPVLVGTVMAPVINWTISIYALACAILIQIGTNLVNDAIDFKKGADTHERLGPVRVTQMGLLSAKQVMFAALICFMFSLALCIPLIERGGINILFIGLISILCAYTYTGGPYPLAYLGLGELFVMIFFGWISTCTVFYLQTEHMSAHTIVAGTQIGFLSMLVIAINNLRDINQDAKVNKRTLAVRCGKFWAKVMILGFLAAPYLLNFMWGFILPWLTLPIACLLGYKIWVSEPGRIYNTFFGMSTILHLLFGLALAAGFYFK